MIVNIGISQNPNDRRVDLNNVCSSADHSNNLYEEDCNIISLPRVLPLRLYTGCTIPLIG